MAIVNLQAGRTPALFDEYGIPEKYAKKFLEVANREGCVIMVRAPGKYVSGLLADSYAAKGFHTKAKSSNWGPMAGFVMADANLSKASFTQAGYDTQREEIKHAYGYGANKVHLIINQKRLNWLLAANAPIIERYQGNNYDVLLNMAALNIGTVNRNITLYSATFSQNQITTARYNVVNAQIGQFRGLRHFVFALQKCEVNGDKPLYKVWYKIDRDDTGQNAGEFLPAYSIVDAVFKFRFSQKKANRYYPSTNPHVYEPPLLPNIIPEANYKLATAADYDLFLIWKSTRGVLDSDLEREKDLDKRSVPAFFMRNMAVSASLQNPERGNISDRIKRLRFKLNDAFKTAGYTGGDLVHHGDEGGRPAVNGLEDAFFVFFPNDSRLIGGGNSRYEQRAFVITPDGNNAATSLMTQFATLVDRCVALDTERENGVPRYLVTLNPNWIKIGVQADAPNTTDALLSRNYMRYIYKEKSANAGNQNNLAESLRNARTHLRQVNNNANNANNANANNANNANANN